MTIRSSQCRSRAGFTMLEILVTVSIIITLIGLAIYGLAAAKKSARRAETVARLGAISNALTQYQNDFGDLPPSYSGNSYQGSQMLTEALLGWSKNDGASTTVGDGSDFGFRTTTGGRGKIYGPYIQPDNKTFYPDTKSTAEPYNSGNVFIDARGYSILYYKAIPQKLNHTTRAVSTLFSNPSSSLVDWTVPANFTTASLSYIYQSAENTSYWHVQDGTVTTGTLPDPRSATDFLKLLGDTANTGGTVIPGNNTVDSGELIQGIGSFLLVAPGEDGLYFTADDVISGSK